MSDDVIIPSDRARSMASAFREIADTPGSPRASAVLREYADLLDPPPPSLRDEVAEAIRKDGWTCDFHEPDEECRDCEAMTGKTADSVLAVVRKHYRTRVENMRGWDGGVASMDWSPDGPWVDRSDVLALLGGSDE